MSYNCNIKPSSIQTIYGESGSGIIVSTSNNSASIGLWLSGNREFKQLEEKVQNLENTISTLTKKLCILTEDPEKLEKYESLRNAYNEYKVIEGLVYGTENDGASK